MPRKTGRKVGGRQDSCTMPFHFFFSTAMVGGTLNLTCTPANFSSRAGVEADAWAHFKVRNLRFRLHPNTDSGLNPRAAGWVGGVQDTPPSTITQVMELLPSTIITDNQTTPSDWVSVPKADLAGPFPWYKTVAGAADPTEESPGAIIIAGTGTEVIQLEIRGIFEFKTSVATANTPAARMLRERVRAERLASLTQKEKEVLLKILQSPVPQAIDLKGVSTGVKP